MDGIELVTTSTDTHENAPDRQIGTDHASIPSSRSGEASGNAQRLPGAYRTTTAGSQLGEG